MNTFHSKVITGSIHEIIDAVEYNLKLINESNESEKPRNEFNIDVYNEYGATPLHACCFIGNLEICNYLISLGADVNAITCRSDLMWMTPLHIAAAFGHKPIILSLLTHGADPYIKDYKGFTAYQIAKMQNHKKTAALIKSFVYEALKKESLFDSSIAAEEKVNSVNHFTNEDFDNAYFDINESHSDDGDIGDDDDAGNGGFDTSFSDLSEDKTNGYSQDIQPNEPIKKTALKRTETLPEVSFMSHDDNEDTTHGYSSADGEATPTPQNSNSLTVRSLNEYLNQNARHPKKKLSLKLKNLFKKNK